jgi:hypothetical protein
MRVRRVSHEHYGPQRCGIDAGAGVAGYEAAVGCIETLGRRVACHGG